MSNLDELVYIPTQTAYLYFLIDCSDNMDGSKIGSLNDAMANIFPMLDKIQYQNPYAKIVLKILSININTKVRTIDNLENFIWENIEGNGDFFFGKALDCLYDDLRRNFNGGNYDPIIIVLTASHSKDEWRHYLKRLSNLDIFEWSHKIAISIGPYNDNEMLRAFTRNEKRILTNHNIDDMKDLIRITYSCPEWDASDGIDFHKCKGDIALIIDKAIEIYGKEILLSPQLIHILNDYNAFADERANQFIFKTIQKDPYFENLLNSCNWHQDSNVFSQRLSNCTGIERSRIKKLLNYIALGLHITINRICDK